MADNSGKADQSTTSVYWFRASLSASRTTRALENNGAGIPARNAHHCINLVLTISNETFTKPASFKA